MTEFWYVTKWRKYELNNRIYCWLYLLCFLTAWPCGVTLGGYPRSPDGQNMRSSISYSLLLCSTWLAVINSGLIFQHTSPLHPHPIHKLLLFTFAIVKNFVIYHNLIRVWVSVPFFTKAWKLEELFESLTIYFIVNESTFYTIMAMIESRFLFWLWE